MSTTIKAGDSIRFLDEYRFCEGRVLSVGPKNMKILSPSVDFTNQVVVRKPHDKCAALEEEVAVIWEMWRGRNGRGGYRIERENYSHIRKPAKLIGQSERHNEKALGVLA